MEFHYVIKLAECEGVISITVSLYNMLSKNVNHLLSASYFTDSKTTFIQKGDTESELEEYIGNSSIYDVFQHFSYFEDYINRVDIILEMYFMNTEIPKKIETMMQKLKRVKCIEVEVY